MPAVDSARLVGAVVAILGLAIAPLTPAVATSRAAASPDARAVAAQTGSSSVEARHGDLAAVSCVSPAFCTAADQNGNVVVYNGVSWSGPRSVDPGGGGIDAVSCATAAFCVAGDQNGNVVVYNGVSWSGPRSVDPGGGGIDAVSCATAAFCVAGDRDGNVVVYNGVSWSGPRSVDPGGGGIDAVSCPTAAFCVAGDQNGDVVTYKGSTWSEPDPIDPGKGGLAAVSCVSTSFCVAVDTSDSEDNQAGLNGNAMIYNGATWSAPESVDAYGGGFYSLSCTSTTFCLALDTEGNASEYNGAGWLGVASPNPSSTPSPADIGFYAVSCASATFCAAVGRGGRALTFDGASWSPAALADPNDQIDAISCPTATFCAAVDKVGNALTWDGSAWSPPQAVDPAAGGLATVSCATPSFCVAGDALGRTLTFDGHGWSSPDPTDPDGGGIEAISCPTTSFCAATDAAGNVVTSRGATWSTPQSIAPSAALASLSCATTSFCVAGDANSTGDVFTWNGAGWSGPQLVDPTGDGITGVSCPEPGSCVAVDADGDVVTAGGSRWSGPQPIDPTGGGFTGVSCPEPGSCVAVDADGDVVTGGGNQWSAPQSLDADGQGFAAVSCGSTSFCVAVDRADRASIVHTSAPSGPGSAALPDGSANGRRFYVDCAASGTGNGTRAHPWTSLAGPDSTLFGPGDQLLLARGSTCDGTLAPLGSGAPGRPVVLGAYGVGPLPTIDAGSQPEAVLLHNQQDWTIQDLETTGGSTWGIYVTGTSAAPGGPLVLRHITIRHVVVHSVQGTATTKRSGLIGVIQHGDQRFEDVTISHCLAYDTRQWSGIQVEAGIFQVALGDHIVVTDNVVHDVGGDGIVIGEAADTVTEENVAYNTGLSVTPTVASDVGTPTAIWDFDCIHCLTEGNVDWGSHSSTHDGGDYDIDFGSQYQTVEDNMGLGSDGYCVSIFSDSGPLEASSVIRHNLCMDNGASTSLAGQGDIFFSTFGPQPMDGVQVFGNVLLWDPATSAPALNPSGGTFSGDLPDAFQENVVVAGDPWFVDAGSPVHLDLNRYVSSAAATTPTWTYDGATYHSFAAYQEGSGQDQDSTYTTTLPKPAPSLPSLPGPVARELRGVGQLSFVLDRLVGARRAVGS